MAEAWPAARELMTARPITLSPDAPLSRAIGIMRAKSIHELPVLRNNRLAGMITFESIARRSNLPLTTKVEHLMVLPPLITAQTGFPEVAEQLLAAGLRAAPVVGRRGELVGIISRTDLVRTLPQITAIAERRVDEIMSPVGLTIPENEGVGTLFAQIRLLEEHPLPVVDRKGRLVGAVGIADMGGLFWKPTAAGKRDSKRRTGGLQDVEVGSIMRSPAVTVPSGASTAAAARLMGREKVSSVFVVEEGRPLGVVSQGDLLGLAVGGAEPAGLPKLGDVYVQVHGLRGSSDPAILADIDRVVARGLRRISRGARPLLLSLHITPHAMHRSSDATVAARVYTDRGIFYASQTGWNFYAAVAGVLDDLAEQTRRTREDPRGRGSRRGRAAPPGEEEIADPELERKIRTATGRDAE